MNPRLSTLAAAVLTVQNPTPPVGVSDLVIYGCTPAGITAAIEAKREKRIVTLICRDAHIGGMTTNGLGYADTGDHTVIGGLAKQFYRDVRRYYASRGGSPMQGQDRSARDGADAMYVFEPHVAEAIFETWLNNAGIVPVRSAPLSRGAHSVVKTGARIVSLMTTDGRVFRGKQFIDASYEGDLMAEAGVSFTVGREGNAKYGETLNGVQASHATHHQFNLAVDPYIVPGKPASGLLPRIEAGPAGVDGSGDQRIQSYGYRLCMTKRPDNRAPFTRPSNYDARQYELLGRYLDAGWRELFKKYDPIPNSKTDTNNHGAFSMDDIGMNAGYPTADDASRAKIMEEHRNYQQGLLWFMQNDPRTPADVRAAMKPWGLCNDEFADNGHWPHELYIREARRMIGDFVMTERNLRGEAPTPRSIGLGSYTLDSHNVRRYVDAHGHARNEGDIQEAIGHDYEISYGAVTPRKEQTDNLLVPVAVSASHIAFGSIRMEPVFMILGQSAATAAGIAIDHKLAVQDVPYATLRQSLINQGQLVERPPVSASQRVLSFVRTYRYELTGGLVTLAALGLYLLLS